MFAENIQSEDNVSVQEMKLPTETQQRIDTERECGTVCESGIHS